MLFWILPIRITYFIYEPSTKWKINEFFFDDFIEQKSKKFNFKIPRKWSECWSQAKFFSKYSNLSDLKTGSSTEFHKILNVLTELVNANFVLEYTIE